VGPPWPLPNPLWWSPGLPKCGFPSPNHSRLPTATWIGFAPAIRLLVLPPGTAPGDIKEDFLVLRAFERERCWPFAGSQDRVPLAFCFGFHRWSGHGDDEVDFLIFRGLSSESAADCFALSPQERITPVVLDCALKREADLRFCQVLDENRDEKVLSDILRRGDALKRAGAYVSARSD
jgi:hypothetical protein